MIHCADDADYTIAIRGIENARDCPCVVVADDIDVFAMLVHHLETNSKQLIMQRPSSSFYININTLVNALPPNIRERFTPSPAVTQCHLSMAGVRPE